MRASQDDRQVQTFKIRGATLMQSSKELVLKAKSASEENIATHSSKEAQDIA